MTSIQEDLRDARKRMGWSQRELASRSGIGQSHIQRIEQGSDVRLSTLQRIAQAMGGEIVLLPAEVVQDTVPSTKGYWAFHDQPFLDALKLEDDDWLIAIEGTAKRS